MKTIPTRVPQYPRTEGKVQKATIIIEFIDGHTQVINTGPQFFIIDKNESLIQKARLLAQHIAGNQLKNFILTN